MSESNNSASETSDEESDNPASEQSSSTESDGESAAAQSATDSPSAAESTQLTINRRNALTIGGLIAFLYGSATPASADAQGTVGTGGDPLTTLHTEEINGGVTDGQALTNVAGTNLNIDDSGTLNVSGSNKWAKSDGDELLEPAGSETGIDVTDVQTDSLNGDVTGGTDLTSVTGTGLTISGNSLGISDNDVGTTQLDTPFTDLSTLFGSSVTAGANIDLGGNNLVSSGGAFSITTGSGNLTLNPTSDIDASNNNLNNVASIDNGGSTISVADGLDLQAGGINNIVDNLKISSDSNLILAPSGTAVDLFDSDINSVNGINSSGELRIETETPSSDPIKQSAPDTDNVSTTHLINNELAFALDKSNTDLDVYIRDSNDTAGTISIGSYSTERLKANVQPYAGKPGTVLDIESKTFTAGNGDGDDRLGITAESAHDAGLDWLVDYVPVDDALQTEDGITDSYVEEYGIERDGETVVPNDIHDRAWLAMHHELLREETETVSDHRARIDDLEADLAAKDDRIADQQDRIERLESTVKRKDEQLDQQADRVDDLEVENDDLRAENEQLRKRVAAIESELGLDTTADHRGVADD